MERHDGEAIQWIETVELAPGARESWVCCLEPGEIVAVSLSASGPVDAALVDLDAYETWEPADEMPSSPRFANDTRSVDWQAQPSSPLYTVVLVVFNPGVQSVQVKAIVKALPSEHQATESGGTADSGTPVTHGKSFQPH